MDLHTRLAERLHIAAIGCYFVALAIYSIILPVYYILRKMDEPI